MCERRTTSDAIGSCTGIKPDVQSEITLSTRDVYCTINAGTNARDRDFDAEAGDCKLSIEPAAVEIDFVAVVNVKVCLDDLELDVLLRSIEANAVQIEVHFHTLDIKEVDITRDCEAVWLLRFAVRTQDFFKVCTKVRAGGANKEREAYKLGHSVVNSVMDSETWILRLLSRTQQCV
jgi:hypothetical protein